MWQTRSRVMRSSRSRMPAAVRALGYVSFMSHWMRVPLYNVRCTDIEISMACFPSALMLTGGTFWPCCSRSLLVLNVTAGFPRLGWRKRREKGRLHFVHSVHTDANHEACRRSEQGVCGLRRRSEGKCHQDQGSRGQPGWQSASPVRFKACRLSPAAHSGDGVEHRPHGAEVVAIQLSRPSVACRDFRSRLFSNYG